MARRFSALWVPVALVLSAVTQLNAQQTAQAPANPEATPHADKPKESAELEVDIEKDYRLQSVAWVQNAAEYQVLTRQTYRLAAMQLLTGLNDAYWSADEVQLEANDFQTKPPAVILDLDETVLDNSAFNARNIIDGKSYSQQAWNDWCKEEKAGAICGAKEFLTAARQLGVKVFFITNRQDEVKEATIHNLNALDLGIKATVDNVLTRNDEDGRGGDKLSRRATVSQNYRILLLIGDNLSDICDGMEDRDQARRNEVAAEKAKLMGSRWIVMPNPVYGSWERSLPTGEAKLHLKQ